MKQEKYSYPVHLLDEPAAEAGSSMADDKAESQKLEQLLREAGVLAEVVRVTHGPSVSRFELRAEPSTRISSIVKAERSIASEMGCGDIRFEIPIPGTPFWGIEVPSKTLKTVTFKEVLQSGQMQSEKSALKVALGRDVEGQPVICDLARMPHLLIGGRAGSGKTVCITTMLHSLMQASPDDVKIILYSAVEAELGEYGAVPHMLVPVLNDPHHIAGALEWAVGEMLSRYQKMRDKCVRNIHAYNASPDSGEEKMPHLVIIADGLDALMQVCPKRTEEAIIRLAQLGRAAGIHLVFAAQRMCAGVLTGLIKANIVSRIAFSVCSEQDSICILDRKGAEKLQFPGDMLYCPQESYAPVRVQGSYVSVAEEERVLAYLNQHFSSANDEALMEKLAKE